MTLPAGLKERLHDLGHLVGNTPLLRIDLTFDGRPLSVYAKAEHLSLTGSIKDRIALRILRSAYETGVLSPSARIIETTSGNTGISFAAFGRALGHPVTIFMPDWLSEERIALIRSFGADIRLVSAAEGGFPTALSRAADLIASTPGAFAPRQFDNEENCAAHQEQTGPEIWWQLHFAGLEPDAFVAGVGTGGTVMGVGRALRERRPSVRVHPLEPSNSPTLRVGRKVGTHRIQGISDEFVPPILKLDELDEIVSVDDGDAIIMAQRIASELGIGVGISSGANLLGAVKVASELDGDPVVVTVFADDNKKYLSTDLAREERPKPDHLSPRIQLRGFGVLKRTCMTCCEGEACARIHLLEDPTGLGPHPQCPRAPHRD